MPKSSAETRRRKVTWFYLSQDELVECSRSSRFWGAFSIGGVCRVLMDVIGLKLEILRQKVVNLEVEHTVEEIRQTT